MTLTSWQMSYNGLTFGAGTNMALMEIDGLRGLPVIRNSDAARPRDQGLLAGLDFAGVRTITLKLAVSGSSASVLETYMQSIDAAFTHQVQTPLPLQYQIAGQGNRQVYCRPRKRSEPLTFDYQGAYYAEVTVQLDTLDPRLYDVTQQTLTETYPGTAPPTPPSLVQKINTVVNTSGVATVVTTLVSGTTTGNTVIICVESSGTGNTVSSITGGSGGFTKVVNQTGTNLDAEIWVGHPTAGTTAFTVTFSSTTNTGYIHTMEFAGLLASSNDTNAVATSTSTTPAVAVTPSQGNDVFIMCWAGNTNNSTVAANNWVDARNITGVAEGAAYWIEGGGDAGQHDTWVRLASSALWVAATACFKPAVSTGLGGMDNVTHTVIGMGKQPYQLAVTPDSTKVISPGGTNNNVYSINTSSYTATAIPLSNTPTGVAITPNGLYAYVSTAANSSVYPITLASNTVGAAISVTSTPQAVAVTPDGSQVWVIHSGGQVYQIFTATNTVGNTTTISGAQFVAFSPDSSTAYVTTTNGTIWLLNTTTMNATLFATSSQGSVPLEGIVVSNDGSSLWVSSSASVEVFNAATGAEIAIIGVPNLTGAPGINLQGIDLTPDGQYAYAACPVDGAVYVISTVSFSVVNAIGIDAQYVQSLVALPNGNAMWVSAGSNTLTTTVGDVKVINITPQIATGTATNGGQYITPLMATITGPGVNPVLTNTTTGQSVSLAITLAAADSLVIDMDAHTVTLNSTTSARFAVVAGSQFFNLVPGANTVTFNCRSYGSSAPTCQFSWYNAWI